MDRDRQGAALGLVERGLLFRHVDAAGPRRGEIFTIPDEILAVLPAPPAIEPPPAHEPPPPTAERRSTDPAFSLFALVSGLDSRWRHAGARGLSLVGRARRLRLVRALDVPAASGRGGAGSYAADATPSGAPPRARRSVGPCRSTLGRAYLRDRAWSRARHRRHRPSVSTMPTASPIPPSSEPPCSTRSTPCPKTPGSPAMLSPTGSSALRRISCASSSTPRGLVLVESRSWANWGPGCSTTSCSARSTGWAEIATSADARLIARRARAPRAAHNPEPCTWSDSNELHAAVAHAPGHLASGRTLPGPRRARAHLALSIGAAARRGPRSAAAARSTGPGASWHASLSARCPCPSTSGLRRGTRATARSPCGQPCWSRRARKTSWTPRWPKTACNLYIQRRLGPLAAEVAAADALELATALRTSGHLPRVDAALRLVAESRGSGQRSAALVWRLERLRRRFGP